jgi:hypothetical protein
MSFSLGSESSLTLRGKKNVQVGWSSDQTGEVSQAGGRQALIHVEL